MYAFSGADSARSPLSPSFHRARRKLLSFVSAAAIAIAWPTVPALAQEAGKYFMARTMASRKSDDLENAACKLADARIQGNMRSQPSRQKYAYARGIAGKGVKVGAVDSGILDFHPQLLEPILCFDCEQEPMAWMDSDTKVRRPASGRGRLAKNSPFPGYTIR